MQNKNYYTRELNGADNLLNALAWTLIANGNNSIEIRAYSDDAEYGIQRAYLGGEHIASSVGYANEEYVFNVIYEHFELIENKGALFGLRVISEQHEDYDVRKIVPIEDKS